MSPMITLCTTLILLTQSVIANVAGGGTGTGSDVSLKESATTIELDNGVVSISIDKTRGSVTKFVYQGVNLYAGGHGGGEYYWSWNAPAFGGPHGTASVVVAPHANHGDYAEVKIHSPWSGKFREAAMDVDVYYSLKRGAQGYYAAAILSHPENYPETRVNEWRSNTYISPIFDWLSVDDMRSRIMPSPADGASSQKVAGAPKEVSLLTTGVYAGKFECKYSYSADLGDLDVWGWTSSSKHLGIWMTVPSHEYYNGGPMKRELTGHLGQALLNMLNGTHYGMGNSLVMEAGKPFKKTFGPFLIYANRYEGAAADPVSKVADVLWKDAKAQAHAEQAAWPYAWFKNADYIPEAGRGSLTGILKVMDAGNPQATAAGVWIGLAPEDNGTDFQMQAKTYQFWAKTDANGHFTLPHVIAGQYNLWAFGGRNIGTLKHANIEIAAGKRLDLGKIEWSPSRIAPTVWDIGIPDRDSKEFRNGAFNYSLWATSYVNPEFADGLTYTIGKSNWRKDWNYAHINTAPWTIAFNLKAAPEKGSPASLYIGLASSETTISVKLNGTDIGSYRTPCPSHPVIRLGSHGAFSETRLDIPSQLLKKGANKLVISQTKGTSQYDYLRLEAHAELTAP